MNTFSHPVKKNNFEASELKVKNKKAQKSERRESKKMIDKMISEDQEIKEEIYINNLSRSYGGQNFTF